MVDFEVFFPFQGKIRIRVRIQIFGSLEIRLPKKNDPLTSLELVALK